MLPTTIRSRPSLGDFTPLSEHQEQTPESFYGGKPILHYHSTGAKAWLPRSQLGALPFFPEDLVSPPTGSEAAELNGALDGDVEQIVDLFVGSESFTVFCAATESGLQIPYPCITLHAIKNMGTGERKIPAVFLQLQLTDGGEDDETYDTVEVTMIPPSSAESEAAPDAEVKKLFTAVSNCSNLHPDPADEDEEDEEENGGRIVFEGEVLDGFSGVYVGASDGSLPPPVPGSSGWITAENMHEYFDADGNWIDGDANEQEDEPEVAELGEGAGFVHPRDGDDQAEGQEDGGSKRQKSDGA